MVYSPRTYLFSAVVALVAVQMQQTTASSLYYDPVTTSGTTEEISGKFPAIDGDVADQDCAITVEEDPTLPDITTILNVPVEFNDLLASASSAPTEPVYTRVGTLIISDESPTNDVNMPSILQGEAGIKDDPNCATGWEEINTRNKRHLETNTNANKDIAKLEAYFGTKMETTLKNLPTEGSATPIPWTGPHWAIYEDSINVVWDEGQPSPAEKYATAFGIDVTDFMNKVSKEYGVDSQTNRTKCETNDVCGSLGDGSKCGIRANTTSGYCVPTWMGMSYAWSPAAMLEAEPNCPVTHNNVTFRPVDLKGLVTSVYAGANVGTVFTGARYNGGNDTIDQYGRHTNAAFRDVNPAFFHITATNLLGRLNSTFIIDTSSDAVVSNQPIRSFKVYEQTAMSLKKAAKTFYSLESYPWNAAAKSIVYIKARIAWIFASFADGGLVATGEIDYYSSGGYMYYLLELDGAGEIIGGEWLYETNTYHPDFLWLPKAKPADDTVTSIGLSYANVKMLLERSVACSDSASTSGSDWSDSTSGSATNSRSNVTELATTEAPVPEVGAASNTGNEPW